MPKLTPEPMVRMSLEAQIANLVERIEWLEKIANIRVKVLDGIPHRQVGIPIDISAAKVPNTPCLFHGPGGALMADQEIQGLTQDLENNSDANAALESIAHYGGRWLIGESITESAGRKIAEALGYNYKDLR